MTFLNDAVKRQIPLGMALAGIRVQLTLAGHQSNETLRSAIMSYLVASRDWDSTAGTPSSAGAPLVPVEVDALTPPLRKSKDGNSSGKKGSGKTPRKPADGKTCYLGRTLHTCSGGCVWSRTARCGLRTAPVPHRYRDRARHFGFGAQLYFVCLSILCR